MGYLSDLVADRADSAVPTSHPVTLTARGLRDSVGVNIHSSYDDTPYAAMPLGALVTVDAVLRLGILHVRDGLKQNPQPYVPNLIASLKSAGVRLLLNTGQPVDTTGGYGTGSSAAAITQLKSATYAGAVDALELTNEWDNSGRASWISEVKAYTAEFYPALKADATLGSIPVYGPAFISAGAYGTFGTDNNNDSVNIHPYSGDVLPEGGFLDTWINAGKTAEGSSKPVIATEFGWHNAMQAFNDVDEQTAADYLIRALVWNFFKGITRSYIYELFDIHPDTADTDPEQHWGLIAVHGTAGSPSTWTLREKPAFAAVRNLLRRVSDPIVSMAAAPTSLDYVAISSPPDGTIVPIARNDGAIDLAIWRAMPLWNGSSDIRLPSQARTLALRFARPWRAELYRPSDNTVTPLGTAVTEVTVPIDGQMSLLRLRPTNA